MNEHENMQAQLERYYALWKDCTAAYEEWSKEQGLSSNGVLVLYSFCSSEYCTQRSISSKWCIPKQTVNTILKDLEKKGYVEMAAVQEDKRSKQLTLTEAGRAFAEEVVGKLRKKEVRVMEKMGLENITALNDHLALFTDLFREEDTEGSADE